MMFLKRIAGAALMFGSGLLGSPAPAGYIVTLQEVGSDVVATGGGEIELNGLFFQAGIRQMPAVLRPVSRLSPASTTTNRIAAGKGRSRPQAEALQCRSASDLLVRRHTSPLISRCTWPSASHAGAGGARNRAISDRILASGCQMTSIMRECRSSATGFWIGACFLYLVSR